MAVLKLILTIAITMAIAVTLTMRSFSEVGDNASSVSTVTGDFPVQENLELPSKRHGRFLQRDYHERNPRAADHCRYDNEVCYLQGKNSTCCNNKCMDLSIDRHNCGACKKKCKFPLSCCRGECVYLAYDKRHCGRCHNRCAYGQYCLYGLCDYA